MDVDRRLKVPAAVLLAALCASPQGHASPAAPWEVVTAGGERAAESLRAVHETSTHIATTGADTDTDTDTTGTDTTSTDTTDTDTTGADMLIVEEEPLHAVPPQQFAVPLPRRWGRGDKRLRHDRGMLAAGIIFAAVCGAGAGLGVWALVDRRSRPYGSDTSDAVAAVTGLFSCTFGAMALAAAGAARLKKRRGR